MSRLRYYGWWVIAALFVMMVILIHSITESLILALKFQKKCSRS